jgi:hypothetical protein
LTARRAAAVALAPEHVPAPVRRWLVYLAPRSSRRLPLSLPGGTTGVPASLPGKAIFRGFVSIGDGLKPRVNHPFPLYR